MALGRDDLRHIAKLSSIDLSEDELERLGRDVESILEFVAKLFEVDTEGVEPCSHVHGTVNAFREDIVKDSLTVEHAIENSKDTSRDFFRVPRIVW